MKSKMEKILNTLHKTVGQLEEHAKQKHAEAEAISRDVAELMAREDACVGEAISAERIAGNIKQLLEG